MLRTQLIRCFQTRPFLSARAEQCWSSRPALVAREGAKGAVLRGLGSNKQRIHSAPPPTARAAALRGQESFGRPQSEWAVTFRSGARPRRQREGADRAAKYTSDRVKALSGGPVSPWMEEGKAETPPEAEEPWERALQADGV